MKYSVICMTLLFALAGMITADDFRQHPYAHLYLKAIKKIQGDAKEGYIFLYEDGTYLKALKRPDGSIVCNFFQKDQRKQLLDSHWFHVMQEAYKTRQQNLERLGASPSCQAREQQLCVVCLNPYACEPWCTKSPR